jgi:hypothetical protein
MNMITFFLNREQKVSKLSKQQDFILLNDVLLCICLTSVYGHLAFQRVKQS